ncbi:MAG: response regulator [Capsulimonas sp.]|uniref:Response regulator n=1 Tax=Capsulimonas corticalis TaxID=2219043 RepID=A0A402D6N4_9BACT|nr:response regulator [Capsulimonas corticalis]BDI30599.1 response regulator [Capsulimonas corticalis]
MAKTALIVDDSTSMRQMVGFTLKGAGFTVLEGGNGQEALAKLASAPGGKVDLIITDLNMPVMDGLTFIKEARTKAGLRFTPILMLTTESGDGRKAEGKAAGATGWIVKPFHPEQLLKVIEKVLPA